MNLIVNNERTVERYNELQSQRNQVVKEIERLVAVRIELDGALKEVLATEAGLQAAEALAEFFTIRTEAPNA